MFTAEAEPHPTVVLSGGEPHPFCHPERSPTVILSEVEGIWLFLASVVGSDRFLDSARNDVKGRAE
jgi:hypothetical protein